MVPCSGPLGATGQSDPATWSRARTRSSRPEGPRAVRAPGKTAGRSQGSCRSGGIHLVRVGVLWAGSTYACSPILICRSGGHGIFMLLGVQIDKTPELRKLLNRVREWYH